MRITNELRLTSGVSIGTVIIKQGRPDRLLESEPYRKEAMKLVNFLEEHLVAGTFDEFCRIVNNRRKIRAIKQLM